MLPTRQPNTDELSRPAPIPSRRPHPYCPRSIPQPPDNPEIVRTRYYWNKGMMTMRIFLTSAIAVALLSIAACDKAKSPDEVSKDVANAEQKAATEVAHSEQSASKDLEKAADSVGDKLLAFNNSAAKDAYDLAVAKADGNRKIALAKCLASGGDAQKACKDQAEADYDAAKANAKAAAQSEKQ